MLMYLSLVAFIILFSFTSILGFADSAADIELLLNAGDKFSKLQRFEEAISYYDKVLEIEPNHVDALYKKGSVLYDQDNYYDAMSYFDKVLQIDPYHGPALIKILGAATELGHKPVDGYVEEMVHDSQGHLVAYLKTTNLLVHNHEIATNLINEWPVKKVIKRDGQQFEVLEYEDVVNIRIDNIYGGLYGIRYPYSPEIWLIFGQYYWYPVEKGDVVTYVYTVFRPVE